MGLWGSLLQGQRFGANAKLSKHLLTIGRGTQARGRTNKHTDIPGAAVHRQTRGSWQCLPGPRPALVPADRRQMRLFLEKTKTVVTQRYVLISMEHTATNSQA